MIHRLLAVDPGKKHNGWALFEEGELLMLGLTRGRDAYATAKAVRDTVASLGMDVNVLVIESQEIYRGPNRKNPNDMLEVAFASGCLAGMIPHQELVRPLPRVWTKGQKKEIRHARLLDAARSPMTDWEMSAVLNYKAPKTLKHNVIDAVALGLYALKRL